jgi:hypothetical protein
MKSGNVRGEGGGRTWSGNSFGPQPRAGSDGDNLTGAEVYHSLLTGASPRALEMVRTSVLAQSNSGE